MRLLANSDDFDIESLIKRKTGASFNWEYNCDMWRLFPWNEVADTKRAITEFGLAWIEVAGGTAVDAHEHDEEETFVILAGKAKLELEGHVTELCQGDVVYIPRFWRHQMGNPFSDTLKFLDIYWDFKGRSREEYLGVNRDDN